MLASPLTLAQFFDNPLISGVAMSCALPDNRRFNKTAGGLVISSERGARLWQGSIQMAPLPHADASEIDALMALVTGSGMAFLMYDSRSAYPRNDPTGSILGASTPILSAVAANRSDVSISGLPAAYVLSAGDTVAFTYGTSPVRYAMHRVVNRRVANGSGNVSLVQLVPPLRTGYTTGVTQLSLIKSPMVAQVVPGSYVPPEYGKGLVSSPGSFDFMQTLRG